MKPSYITLLLRLYFASSICITANRVPQENFIEITFLNYTFEDSQVTWIDASKGETEWRVEDLNVTNNFKPPQPTSGTRYLRLYQSPGTFSPAKFQSTLFTGQNVLIESPSVFYLSFDYWIHSKYSGHNNIEVYLKLDNGDEVLMDSNFYQNSMQDSKWITHQKSYPFQHSSKSFELIIYGYCGVSNQDGIALDNIILSGEITGTVTSTTYSTSTLTKSTTGTTNSITTTTTSTATTPTDSTATISTESITSTMIYPFSDCAQQLVNGILCPGESFSIQPDACSKFFCICANTDSGAEVKLSWCQKSGHVYDPESQECRPCGQVDDCKGSECHSFENSKLVPYI